MSLLATHALNAFYGDFQALYGVDIDLEPRETVSIIGANGAGKSTLLRTIVGLLSSEPEAVTFDGGSIGGRPAAQVMRLGIAMVPEGRRLFPSLTVEENLRIGGDNRKGDGRWNLETVFDLFPVLRERRRQPGTALSGGQQQMVAIGRALMSNPRLLLCDEISLGMAPIVVNDIYAALPKIQEGGVSLVIVEQDIARALSVSSRVYCLQEGRVTLRGRPSDLTREAIQEAYFGH
jgi:branched-chain amino acid transport system ATP-binding protein